MSVRFGNRTHTKWWDMHEFHPIKEQMLERVFKRECC